MSTADRLVILLCSLPRRLRAQIRRQRHALLEDQLAWSVHASTGAVSGTPDGPMSPRRQSSRQHDELEALWALPARVPDSRR